MTMDIEPTSSEFPFLGHSGQCSALINSDFANYLNLRKSENTMPNAIQIIPVSSVS